jgi:hypothetical protein
MEEHTREGVNKGMECFSSGNQFRPQTTPLPLLICDHIDGDREGLFRLACEHDLGGIVARQQSDPYLPDHATWLKIRSQNYSQLGARSYSSVSAETILTCGFELVRSSL